MSTRATYKINNTTIYIHHDGYEKGAVSYFYNALIYKNKCGGLETYFLRANERAEITESHSLHGDTEYRYNVSGDGFGTTIECLKLLDWETREFKLVSKVPILDFIDEHLKGEEGYNPFKLVKIGYNESEQNLDTIKEVIDSCLSNLIVWSNNNGSKESANWKNQVETLENCLEHFPECTHRIDEIKMFVPILKTYKIEFLGRQLSAIGKIDKFKEVIKAIDAKEAVSNLYDKYQDISGLKLVEGK